MTNLMDRRVVRGAGGATADSYTSLDTRPTFLIMRGDSLDEDAGLMRSYISRLWGEDWDCPEDNVYDTW